MRQGIKKPVTQIFEVGVVVNCFCQQSYFEPKYNRQLEHNNLKAFEMIQLIEEVELKFTKQVLR